MTEGIVTPSVRNTELTARGTGGRAIGYAEYGDPNGKPVVAFHGFGDSRLTRHPDDDLTARLGVRLITFDRPGIGRTDPMKALTILDRTDDVIDLVNSLGLQKFAILGWSGGAPFALAAAGCIPERVTRVAIAGGFGPFERPGFKRQAPKELRRVMTILKVAPWMSTVMATESEKQMKSGGASAMGMDSGLGSSSDASLLNASDIRSVVTAGAEEAFRQGPAGIASDMLLLFRFKWGFNPEQVRRPVELFYGDDDHVTPVEVGKGLASILPDARLRTKPGAGHLLYLRYWEEILRTLIEEPEARVAVPTTTFVPPEAAPTPAPPAEEPEAVPSTPAAFDRTPFQQAPSWWAIPEKVPEKPVAAEAAAPSPADEAAVQEATGDEAPSEEAPREAVPIEPARPIAAAPVADAAPAIVPERRPAPSRSAADEIARLRAAGFLLDEPEPEPADVGEAPLETPAETEAAPAVAELAPMETVAAEPEAAAAAPAEAEPVEAATVESAEAQPVEAPAAEFVEAEEIVEPAAAGPAEAEGIEEAAAAPAEPAAATPTPAEAVTEAPVAGEPAAEAPTETKAKPKKARTTRSRTRKAKPTEVVAEAAATEPAAEEAVGETATAGSSAEQATSAQPAAEAPEPEPLAQAEPVVEAEAETAERAPEAAEPAESKPLEPAAELTTVESAAERGEPAAEAPAEGEREPVEQPAATERGPDPVTAMAETPLRGDDEAVERLRAAGFLLPETESLSETSAASAQTNGTATGASDDHDRLRAAGFALPGEEPNASGVADVARAETAELPAPSGWVSEEIAAVVEVPEEAVEPAPEAAEAAASEPARTQPAATEPVDAAEGSDESGGEDETDPPHTPEELAMIERLRAAGFLGVGR